MSATNNKGWVKENSPMGSVDSGSKHPIILFDGVCNLCNGWVNFVIDHNSGKNIRFASLQSEPGRRVLLENGLDPNFLDSLVLVEDGQCFFHSTSILRTIKHLNGLWPLLFVFSVIPAPIRDWIYRWIASRRYQWFGKQETCRIPTPDLEARFLR